MQRIKLALVFGSALFLMGCGTPRVASVSGEARVITAPEYALKGATTYDQNWIDETTEAGVAGLGWKRPKPRPPAFDAKPMYVKAAPGSPNEVVKKRWWQR